MPLQPEEFRKRTRFIIKLGRALHECGANSERIERNLLNVTGMLGLHACFLVSPTTFTCAQRASAMRWHGPATRDAAPTSTVRNDMLSF